MRERKYRAWDKRDKVMREVISLNFHTCRMSYWGEHEEYLHIDFSDIELLQYIGRQDINNKDIYEGDITINEMNSQGVVEFFNNLNWDGGGSLHSGFYCKEWCQYPDPGDLSYHDGFDNCEIIGNIYKNPELLEK